MKEFQDPQKQDSWVSRRAVLIAIAIFLPAAAAMFGFFVPLVGQICGQAPLDTRLAYSASEVSGFVQSCGVVGLDQYRVLQVADIVYPAIAAAFFITVLLFIWRPWVAKGSKLAPLLVSVPIISMAADYQENVFAWQLLSDPSGFSATMINAMSAASTLKTAAGWTTGLLIVFGVGIRIQRRLRGRSDGQTPQPLDPATLEPAGRIAP